MMQNVRSFRSYWYVLVAGLLSTSLLPAKNAPKPASPDRIEVIAHVPLSGSPVVHIVTGVHWRRDLLYLEHGDGNSITVLDVTHPGTPTPAETIDLPTQEANRDVRAVVGTAVLVASSQSTPVPQTITILSYADPERPQVVQQFSGVTSLLRDVPRGLVYLTNLHFSRLAAAS